MITIQDKKSPTAPTQAAPAAQNTAVPNKDEAAPAQSLSQPTQVVSQADQVKEEQPRASQEESQDVLSPKFAQLAKREKAIRAQASEIKAREASLKAQAEEAAANAAMVARLKQRDPKLLRELGYTYDEVVNQYLNEPSPEETEFQRVHDELKSVKDNFETFQKRQEEERKAADQKAYDAAISQLKVEAQQLTASSDDYSLIHDMGQHEAVVALIEQVFTTENRVMTVQEAAQQVEAYLEEEMNKFMSYKKVQAKFKQKEVEQEPAEPAQAQSDEQPQQRSWTAMTKSGQIQVAPRIKTLTNEMSGNTKPLTDKDRRARAIAIFNGQLKT